MEIHMPRVRIGITLSALIMEMYMSREVSLTLTGLTMDIYIPREGWDPLNRVNHGGAYVKRELVSH